MSSMSLSASASASSAVSTPGLGIIGKFMGCSTPNATLLDQCCSAQGLKAGAYNETFGCPAQSENGPNGFDVKVFQDCVVDDPVDTGGVVCRTITDIQPDSSAGRIGGGSQKLAAMFGLMLLIGTVVA